MEEEATTGVPVATGAQSIQGIPVDENGSALPDVQADTDEPAEDTTSGTSNDDDQQGETVETEEATGAQDALPGTTDDSYDKKLATYAKGQGIDDITSLTKRERALLKSAYDSKADRDRMKTSELDTSATITEEQINPDATPEQRENVRLRNIELQLEISRWKRENPEKLSQEASMVEILSDQNKRLLVQEGYLTLDDVYSMARGRGISDDSLKAEGKREALQDLASKQQASVPRGSAVNGVGGTTSGRITPQNVDQMVASMSIEEYRKRLPDINAALNGR